MTTATLQTKMTDIVARLDKACGKSFIGENQKCTKTPVQSKSLARPDNAALRRNLLTGVGLAVTGVVLGAIAKGYSEIKESGLPDSAITPKEPPKGYYDSLTPGDLLYRTFPDDVFGVTRAHYAVYAGRDAAGEHTVLHATTKYDLEGNEVGSHVKQQTIKDYNPETSFKKAERSDPSRKQTTTAQLHRIIKDLEGKDVTWNGFTENCESFARAVSNDLPVATQSKKVNPVTRQIVRGILNLMYPGMEGKGKLTNKDIVATVNKSKVDSMNPKAQAAQILSPIFNGRPLTVMSVSLSPEGNPTGVFRGEPRPGQTHYYTFNMGQKVQFRRIMGKTDGMDEACGCTECKKHKRTKAECECAGKTDGITKTHKVMREFKNGELTTHGKPVTSRKQAIAIALSEQSRGKKKKRPKGEAFEKVDALLERLDKKCGASGIPDGAKCTKAEGGAAAEAPASQPTLVRRAGKLYLLDHPSEMKEGDEIQRKLPPEATAAQGKPKGKTSGKQILKNVAGVALVGAYVGLNVLEARRQFKEHQEMQDRYRKAQQNAEDFRQKYRQSYGGNQTANATKTASGKDWYTVLGIDKNASPAEVKAAFRKKARETHPDNNGGKNKGFNDVNEAWAIAQKQGKVRRGDSIEMEWFLKRMDARSKVTA
jgi:hypothetical protein